MTRPSHKELTGKIKQARAAADNGSILQIEPLSLAGDAIELGYCVEELGRVVNDLLKMRLLRKIIKEEGLLTSHTRRK
jgi:hypothetical protein